MFGKRILSLIITSILLVVLIAYLVYCFFWKTKTSPQCNEKTITEEGSGAAYIEEIGSNYITVSGFNIYFRCSANTQIIKELNQEFGITQVSLNGYYGEIIKYATSEPYLSFSADDAYLLTIKKVFDSEEDAITKIENIFPFLIKKGFKIDKINSIYKKHPNLYPRLALNKDRDLYILEPTSFSDHTSINIACIQNDIQKDIIRNTLLEINQVAKYDLNQILTIQEIGDSAFHLSIHGINYGGGHSDYWFKVNGKWKNVFSGSIDPPCSTLNKYHVGKGIMCWCEKDDPDYSTCHNVVDY